MEKQISQREVTESQIDLLSLAEGFFQSTVLFSLHRLRIFEFLGEGQGTIEVLALATKARQDTLARLLNAGVVLGILEVGDGDAYQVKEKWKPLLVRPLDRAYLGNWLGFLDYLDFAMKDLHRAAVEGGPTIDLLESESKKDIREFTLAMHNYAALRGEEIVHFLDVSGCRTMLDLGCGPGTYAFHLASQHPGLEIYLLDLPEILEVTREVQARFDLKNTFHFLPIDVTQEEIPGTYDLVLVSNTLHMLGEKNSKSLLKRLYQHVNPGGSLVVQAQYMNKDYRGGRWPVLLDLVQMCITPNGRNHTEQETRQWMKDAGYEDVQYIPMSVFNTNKLIRGYRH